ncbi:hypothetical protein IWQ47_000764 [Aquimarina sp. EL_43]|uniref:hypothetical protein n=1 Tax=unclassified Aquimarina TaxID=2627091 RepID=UPI0018CAD6B2|nr:MULTISPECIES: hypothetical protein [unclassified Aquimarina]MBG6128546.1 hypothetical protein [Aquimarina sp. EL_35]MBG6149609.1 hypothetical protein [Aquimarina sp. EL_32]MBG6167706.1 hypothetical protein [Aquimarina sp. EL_43]
MKIKKVQNKKSHLIIMPIVFFALFISSLLFQKNNSLSNNNEQVHNTEIPTTTLSEEGISEMIDKNINKIYSDSEFSIYYKADRGVPKIYYVYKDSLTNRQLNDAFFIHIFPKDEEALLKLQKYNYINLDFFDFNPIELKINNETYFVFTGVFSHKTLTHFLEPNKIKFFNTGRFSEIQGRSYQADGINFENLSPDNTSNTLEKITISINKKNFEKVKSRRNEALKSKILIKKDDDFVTSKVSYNTTKNIKSRIRLKGDWTDHLDDEKKWSFRVILENENLTIRGMSKFSIQHPKVRNYEWEWLFQKVIKNNDLIGLRYDFINVDIEIKEKDSIQTIPLGIMAIEESFDKRLIENNKRREGIILSFDESLLWEDRKKSSDLKLNVNSWSKKLQNTQNLPIKVFDESRILSDPVLSKQFNVAKNLLEGLKKGKLKISEVFDIDKLTTFVALSNLFGGQHGLINHNLRIYFNPVTNKLEPVCFDSHPGFKIDKITHYPFSKNDSIYTKKLLEKLEIISNEKFIKNFINKFNNDLNKVFVNLQTELKTTVDLSILDYNSNFIKKQINPSNIIVSNLLNIDKKQIQIDINNLSDFPVIINSLEHNNGRRLSFPFSSDPIIHPNEKKLITFYIKDAFNNAFVSKKNKKGGFRYPKDVKKLKIKYKLPGLSISRKNIIIPFGANQDETLEVINTYKKSFVANYTSFNFIEVKNNILTIPKGNHKLNKTLVIPKNHKVIVEKGASIDMTNKASIISYSPIICKGIKNSPIHFFSSDNSSGGIFISNTKKKSILNHCNFTSLSNPTSNLWTLSGAVNFNETIVEISNSVFRNNRSEDGLNIIRSKFLIDSTIFKNTLSDAFDGDFVEGKILNSTFSNNGNDGIDVSGSTIFLKDIVIRNSSDKAISAGESSTIKGMNISVSEGEIGIVSKDLSSISLQNVSISNTKLALSSFQKKSEYGTGSIDISMLTLQNNELDYLIENGSQLLIDKTPVRTVSNKVIDQMYGKKYGKSSK